MKPCIFIHTNEKQIVGALVSKYSFERFAADKNAFDVKLIHTRDYHFLEAHEAPLSAWRPQARMEERRSPVLHSAAFHAARAHGL